MFSPFEIFSSATILLNLVVVFHLIVAILMAAMEASTNYLDDGEEAESRSLTNLLGGCCLPTSTDEKEERTSTDRDPLILRDPPTDVSQFNGIVQYMCIFS